MRTTYETGTVTVAANGTVVTGVGTYWDMASIQEGDMFLARGLTVPIASVDSPTKITLAMGWPGAALSGSAYFVKYEQMSNRTTAKTIELINEMTDLQDGVVSYEAQSPTAAEMAQARANLGLSHLTQDSNASFVLSPNALARLVVIGNGTTGAYTQRRADTSSAWATVPYSVTSGGTGGTTPAEARASLGLSGVSLEGTTQFIYSQDSLRRLVIQNGGTASGDWWMQRRADTSSAWETAPLTIGRGGTGATAAAAARTNLGLGTAAIKNTGAIGDAVPLLNVANTWSADQTFSTRIGSLNGYRSRFADVGTWGNNYWNFGWASPNLLAFVDTTLIGTVISTTSDRALKKDISPVSDKDTAASEVLQWVPSTFKFRARGVLDESGERLGFIANELKEVSPECVQGDGLPEGSNIEVFEETPYSLDHSAMIAKLTLALQSALERISDLERRVPAVDP